jgi:hypothetical protein
MSESEIRRALSRSHVNLHMVQIVAGIKYSHASRCLSAIPDMRPADIVRSVEKLSLLLQRR